MSIKNIDFQDIIKCCSDGKRKTIALEKLTAWLKKRRMYKGYNKEARRVLSDLGYNFSLPIKFSQEAIDDLRAGDGFPIPIMDFSTYNK